MSLTLSFNREPAPPTLVGSKSLLGLSGKPEGLFPFGFGLMNPGGILSNPISSILDSPKSWKATMLRTFCV